MCVCVYTYLYFISLESTLQSKLSCEEQIKSCDDQVQVAEQQAFYPDFISPPDGSEHEQVVRAHNAIIEANIYSSVFKWVENKEYYNLSLSKRAEILGAHTTNQLCKSMLLENKAFDSNLVMNDGPNDVTYAPFYMIVLQYDAAITTKKLQLEIMGLRPLGKRIDSKKFDFRQASEEDNARLSGFTHNAVTPFGMLENVPVILAKAISDNENMTQFIWMGGGHVQLKVGMSVKEFVDAKQALVLDVTDPR